VQYADRDGSDNINENLLQLRGGLKHYKMVNLRAFNIGPNSICGFWGMGGKPQWKPQRR
jgi:hypothetical protein